MSADKLETKTDLLEVYKRYVKDIYKFIFVRVNMRREIAEDLTQDVFVKVWEKRNSFDRQKASLKTWIYVVARNTLIDHYRKNKRLTGNIEEKTDIGPEEINTEADLRDFVLQKLESLKDNEKELLTLHYIQGLNSDEIARIIKKKNSTAKVAIHRALKKLRKTVNETN